MKPDYIIHQRPEQPSEELDTRQFETISYEELDKGPGLGALAGEVAMIVLETIVLWLQERKECLRADMARHRRRRRIRRKVRKAKQEYREVGAGRTSCSGPRKQQPKRIIRVVIEDY